MNKELELLLSKALANDRIAKRVEETGLTHEQQMQALPIFVSMLKEDNNTSLTQLTSFYVAPSGSVMLTFVPSEKGKAIQYLDNIVTRHIFPINLTGEKFDKTIERKALVNLFVKYTKDEIPKKGLYIYGDMGVGKTFILTKFAKKLAEIGKQVGFINVPQLVGTIKQTFSKSNEKKINIVNTLQDVDYLFVDDIGAEAISGWFRDEILFSILNHRMDHGKPTFYTSNYSQQDLIKIEQKTSGQKYPDKDKALRLIDRVKATSVEVPLLGKNRRY